MLTQRRTIPAIVTDHAGRPVNRPAPDPGSDLLGWARRAVEKIKSQAFAGRLTFLPYLDNGTEETPEIRRAYPHMLREAMVKSGFLTKVLGVAALDVSLSPEDKADPRQVEAAEFAEHCLRSVRGGKPGVAWAVLAGPLVRGWGLAEKVYAVETRGRFAGKWKWKAIKAKDPELLGLDVDPYRNVTAVRSALDPGAAFDPAGFVLTSHLSLYENPFGTSDFRAAYRPFWVKDTAWKLRGLHLQRYTGPYLKGTYTDEAQRAALELALADAHSSSWCAVPAGTLIDAVDLSMKGTTDYEASIRDCDREILVSLVGSYLQILEGQVVSGRGDTKVHKETSELFQWSLSALLSQVYNEQLLPELTELNYQDVPPPVASTGAVSDSDLAASLAIDQGLQEMGFPLDVDKVAEFYGRQPAADPAKTLRPVSAPPPPAQPFAEGEQGRPFPWEEATPPELAGLP